MEWKLILINTPSSMKKCFKCNKEKILSNFYKHSQMKDGYVNKCINCCKKEANKRLEIKMKDPVFCEKEKARQLEKDRRLYRKSLKPFKEPEKGIHKEIWKNHKEKYPEKFLARKISQYIKSPTKGNEMHHWNYNESFAKDLIDLSKSDHYKAHRHLIYVQELKIYKSINNEFLDTKEKHINYLNSLNIKTPF